MRSSPIGFCGLAALAVPRDAERISELASGRRDRLETTMSVFDVISAAFNARLRPVGLDTHAAGAVAGGAPPPVSPLEGRGATDRCEHRAACPSCCIGRTTPGSGVPSGCLRSRGADDLSAGAFRRASLEGGDVRIDAGADQAGP